MTVPDLYSCTFSTLTGCALSGDSHASDHTSLRNKLTVGKAQHNPIHYNTTQRNTTQHNTIHHTTPQYNTPQHSFYSCMLSYLFSYFSLLHPFSSVDAPFLNNPLLCPRPPYPPFPHSPPFSTTAYPPFLLSPFSIRFLPSPSLPLPSSLLTH